MSIQPLVPPTTRVLHPVRYEALRAASHGEMTTAEALNYRTLRPYPGGLYGCDLFGPLDAPAGDADGNLFVAPEPDALDAPRRTRFAHIPLCTPVVHPWAWRGEHSLVAALLELDADSVARLQDGAFAANPGEPLPALAGAAAIEFALSRCEPDAVASRLRARLADGGAAPGSAQRAACEARERVVTQWLATGLATEALVLRAIAVLPPAMRPARALPGALVGTPDASELYRRVFNRNQRAARLIELGAPEVILRNELLMLQRAVDSLFDNAAEVAAGRGTVDPGGAATNETAARTLRSLADVVFDDPAWAPFAGVLRERAFGLAVPAATGDTARALFAMGLAAT